MAVSVTCQDYNSRHSGAEHQDKDLIIPLFNSRYLVNVLGWAAGNAGPLFLVLTLFILLFQF
jgi:hypothetical protein